MELALGRLHVGDIHAEEAGRMAFGPLAVRLVAAGLRQARHAFVSVLEPMAHNGSSLKAPMQRWPGQAWDRRLQGMETVAQRTQCVPAECNRHRLLDLARNGRARFPRACFAVPGRLAPALLRDRLR
ncbi:hypothetical protein, partial [Mangrovicoccus sp. HB161399]|uniref:hypothetical protein n=1 Tax=Mangrovicoccus sp. HB161399 TaxID=2720392 RepID=UPI0015574CDE